MPQIVSHPHLHIAVSRVTPNWHRSVLVRFCLLLGRSQIKMQPKPETLTGNPIVQLYLKVILFSIISYLELRVLFHNLSKL